MLHAPDNAQTFTVILSRGTFVRRMSIDEIMQIYEQNSVIFGHVAARLAVAGAGEQALMLRALVNDMDQAVAANERDAFYTGSTLFHERVLAFSGNAVMERVYLDHTRKLLLLRRRSFDRVGSMTKANAQHPRLLESILASDAALARQQPEAHTRSGRASFLTATLSAEPHPESACRARRPGARPPAPDKLGASF